MIAASMSMIRATLSYTAISTPHVHGLMALFRFAFAAGVSRKPPSMNVRFAAEHPQPPMARMRRIADRRLSNRNRPAATLVKCIEVDDEAEVVIAFAHTSDHARELFDEWNRLAYGGGGKSATVEEMSRWLLKGPQVTLREDMNVGLIGSEVSLRGRLLAHLPRRL